MPSAAAGAARLRGEFLAERPGSGRDLGDRRELRRQPDAKGFRAVDPRRLEAVAPVETVIDARGASPTN